MKKLLIVFICILCILCCMVVPTFAASFDGGEFQQTKYYSVIPWSEVVYSGSSSTFRFDAYGNSYYRTASGHGQVRDPAYAETEDYIMGWTYLDGDEPTLEYLTVISNQVYYSQPSQYYANYINYDFDYNNTTTNVQIQFICRNVHLTRTQWNSLHNYAYLNIPDSASAFDVEVSLTYWGESNNELVKKNAFNTQQALRGDTNINWLPSYDIFSNDVQPFNDGFMIEEMILTINIETFNGVVKLGNLYYNNSILKPDIPVFEKEVYTDRIVEVEVPPEDLNLFNWIVQPIWEFFNIEFYPGISIGGILGAFLAIMIALALIRLWSH